MKKHWYIEIADTRVGWWCRDLAEAEDVADWLESLDCPVNVEWFGW